MCQSEVALLRQKIAAEYEAMKQGLTGFAWGASKHSFIDARMRHVEQYHNQLSEHVGEQEATLTVFHLYNQIIG